MIHNRVWLPELADRDSASLAISTRRSRYQINIHIKRRTSGVQLIHNSQRDCTRFDCVSFSGLFWERGNHGRSTLIINLNVKTSDTPKEDNPVLSPIHSNVCILLFIVYHFDIITFIVYHFFFFFFTKQLYRHLDATRKPQVTVARRENQNQKERVKTNSTKGLK